MNSPTLLATLEVYFEAFAERDSGRRGELLSRCFTERGEIWGPNQLFAGHAAISEKIARFHDNWPGCRLVLATGVTTFSNFMRFGNAIVGVDGSVLATGETIIELAPNGRMSRVVPFWEAALPLLPDTWPKHLAVSTSPAPDGTQPGQ